MAKIAEFGKKQFRRPSRLRSPSDLINVYQSSVMKRFPIGNVRNDFDKIVTLAKIASIIPITDVCLERGASAVKCMK